MRMIRLAAGCALGAALVTAPGASADPTQRFTFVASPVGFFISHENLPAGIAPTGQLRFTPRRSSFTIRIDDGAILDGQTVAVWVHWSKKDPVHCLRVRTAETIRGVVPGREMMVTILTDSAWGDGSDPRCTGHAIAGVAEVRL